MSSEKRKIAYIDGKPYEIGSHHTSILKFVKGYLGEDKVPTLCDDPNLAPYGACRVCSVEVALVKADLGVLNPANPENREGLIIAAFLITVAIVGKVITGWTVFGQSKINRLAIGVGMIPRGEVGLVFAGIGSASGVLDKPLEAAIIVMVILTTFLAPPLLQLALKRNETSPPDDGATPIVLETTPAELVAIKD